MLKRINLIESITHLEDSSIDEFISTVETLSDKIITEKLDGANLWFGVDENGFFTSREGKSTKSSRFYEVDDYALTSNFNGFRAAHLALEKVESIIKKYLSPGDMVEIEVLFGRQPNTVTYGSDDKNFIVILRPVNDTEQEKVNKLSKALNGKKVNIESTVVSSLDGDNLQFDDILMTWEFTQVKPLNAQKIDMSEVDKIMSSLKAFLDDNNTVVPGKTNKQVIEVSLTSIPKNDRELVKKERDRLSNDLLNNFKLPIKELLLNRLVRKVKPFLQSKNLHPDEDIGVEGVVVRDPISGSQIKIVDKDVFTAINSFNSSVRSAVSGLVKTTDQDAPIEYRGGAFGQAKIRIAELLGPKELAMSSSIKRFISKYKKNSAQETAENLGQSLGISDIQGLKRKISAILENAVDEIDGILAQFKQEAGTYKLVLKTGKEIGLSPEVMKRTLTSFAETKKEIKEIVNSIKASSSVADLLLALYGKTFHTLFTSETNMAESFTLLKKIIEDNGETGAVVSPGSESTTTTTTASSIAPFAFKLLSGKQVVRRKRNFVKSAKFSRPVTESKFSLIRQVQEQTESTVKSSINAKDVDDLVQSKNDVEFKSLRNNLKLSDNVTQMDVSRYLDKAHDLNDEEESVVFGMEMDDGSIIKVYVNAKQAEPFEKSLAELLGKEDDAEKAINDLANTYDIIDVVWPESNNSQTNTSEPELVSDTQDIEDVDSNQDDIDFGIEDEQGDTSPGDGVPGENQDEDEDEDIDLTTGDSEEDTDEDSKNETGVESLPGDEEDSEEDSDEEDSDEEDSDEEDSDEEDSDEEDSDEEDSASADEVPPKKKIKKDQPKESSMKTLGQQFKDRLLSESRKKDKNPESEDPEIIAARQKFKKQLDEILELVTLPREKAILTLMVNLGVPISAINLYRADVKEGIQQPAEHYGKSSSFRLWCKKLLAEMANESVSESSFEDRLQNKFQLMVYHVLTAIGLPSVIEKNASRALLAGVRRTAKMMSSNNNIRVYMTAIAEELGVSDKTKHLSEPELKEQLILENEDVAIEAISKFLTSVGFVIDSPKTLKSQMMTPGFRAAARKLSTQSSTVKRLLFVTDLIDKVTKMDNTASVATNEAENLEKVDSDWIMAKMGSRGIMIKSGEMHIKIDTDEAEKLKDAIEAKKEVSVLTKNSKRYVFKPVKKNVHVSLLDSEDFKVMKSKDVENLLDLIDEES